MIQLLSPSLNTLWLVPIAIRANYTFWKNPTLKNVTNVLVWRYAVVEAIAKHSNERSKGIFHKSICISCCIETMTKENIGRERRIVRISAHKLALPFFNIIVYS